MSEQWRRDQEAKRMRGEAFGSERDGVVYNWQPVVHGHSPQGRSESAKLGWKTRREKASAQEVQHEQRQGGDPTDTKG